MSRADHLPAKLYTRARGGGGVVQHEGFLEDALAAALEEPGVWATIRAAHPEWNGLPPADPERPVITQLVAGEGRADIRLTWATGERLVIELKPWAPPSAAQLERYVKAHPGTVVTAIARWAVPFALDRVLPMTTWGELRALTWPGEPPVWRQLRHLIDAVGAAMPNLDPAALKALVPAWDAFERVDLWFAPTVAAVQRRLVAAGAGWVLKEPRERPGVENAHRRLGRWVWPAPWQKGEDFGIFVGLFAGNANRALRKQDVPDLRFMVHLNHEGPRARALWHDGQFEDAVHRWELRDDAVVREASTKWWFLLDAREPLDAILDDADQAASFKRWMLARTDELIDDGLLARLVAVKP